MNIRDYISSGILEAYVLGEVSEQERAEVEANLQRYPELKEELERVESVQEQLLMRAAVAPRKEVKLKLLEQINATDTQTLASNEAKVVRLEGSSLKWWQFATAASVTLAVIASYYAVNFKNELASTRRNLDELTAQNQRIAQDYNTVNQRLDTIENALRVIDNPAYKRIVMRGTEAAKNALASIYWNETTHEVYLSIQNLRQISKNQQFQLWAIVDGKPVDAGVFNPTTSLLKMKDIQKASAFAVTIEPAGGSVSPTLSSMQVIGTI